MLTVLAATSLMLVTEQTSIRLSTNSGQQAAGLIRVRFDGEISRTLALRMARLFRA